MFSKVKTNSLSLKQKIEVIRLREQHFSVKDLCTKFDCGKTQIYDAIKKKEELLVEFEGGNVSRKRKREARNDDVDELTWQWFTRCKAINLPISGTLLRDKAREFGEELGKTDFKASTGWLTSFRKRHNIGVRQLCGESDEFEKAAVEQWLERLPTLTEGFDACNIFSCCEAGLFYRGIPSQTLGITDTYCKGGEQPEERLTILMCCSMSGEIERPLVIGKSKKPSFENINTNNLPVIYEAEGKAWMTSVLMEDWLKFFNYKMALQSRSILLFMDKVPCHPKLELSNVKIVFLPQNTKLKTQPLNLGVIRTVKTLYKKFLLRCLIAGVDSAGSKSEHLKTVTVLDAVKWISKACREVSKSPEKIIQCFKRAGFPVGVKLKHLTCNLDNDVEELKCVIKEASVILKTDDIDVEKYVSSDDNLCTEQSDFFVDDYMNHENEDEADCDSHTNTMLQNSVDDDCITTYHEALSCISKLQNFYMKNNNEEMFNVLTDLKCTTEVYAVREKLSQK